MGEGESSSSSSSSMERIMADIELLQAAFPDEIRTPQQQHEHQQQQKGQQHRYRNDGLADYPSSSSSSSSTTTTTTTAASAAATASKPLDLTLTLQLDEDSTITFEFLEGYPTTKATSLQIKSFRSSQKHRIETATRAFQAAAQEALEEQMEGALASCSAAIEAWNDYEQQQQQQQDLPQPTATSSTSTIRIEQTETKNETAGSMTHLKTLRTYDWISGSPLVDRKSTFIAHACLVSSEREVHEALQQLLYSSSKIQKATHNMSAWRLTETLRNGKTVLKYDNDDDGEDAAGSRLAQLLGFRNEDGVLVVVSRWYGGIHLGPRRFAHITNTARELLVHCHDNIWKDREKVVAVGGGQQRRKK